MNFIKKCYDKEFDESVHLQFQKFSKGEFVNRAIIQAKLSKGKYAIKTSAEFSNELVRAVAKELGSKKTKVIGAIVSTTDLRDKLECKNVKQFQGVKRHIISEEMSGDQITSLLDEFPKTFFALTFNSDKSQLKIKPKAPKSGKPGKDDEKPKADFCSLKTTNKELGSSFIFERENFGSAIVVHQYFIEKMVIPEILKGEKDFSLLREAARRNGRIIRKAEIDGQQVDTVIEFEA